MAPPKGGGGRGRGRGRKSSGGGSSGGSGRGGGSGDGPTPEILLTKAQQEVIAGLPASDAAWQADAVAAAAEPEPEPEPAAAAPQVQPEPAAHAARGEALRAKFAEQQQSSAYLKMQPGRQKLPALGACESLMRTIEANDVTVVAGGTGCGKSTQVPQFLLDQMLTAGTGHRAHIICTQPRRIAAVGVAERVADERGESIGGSVGYSIRGESKRSADTRLLFCTTGVLLKMLEGDHELSSAGKGAAPVSHVVIDEVHERSCDSDLLLVMCRKMLRTQKQRDGSPRIKLVLMSATVQSQVFADYFQERGLTVGVSEIAGRTFPVERLYLSDAIEHCGYVCSPGRDCARPEVTPAMVAKDNGSGEAAPGDEPNPSASTGEDDEEGGGDAEEAELTLGQKMVAANKEARQKKEKNVAENSASGIGRLGGLAHAWCDRVGQSGMLRDKSAGLGGCSRSTLDTLRVLDHGVCPNTDLIVALVRHIASAQPKQQSGDEGGAVLVFLPGAGEINTTLRAMQADAELGRGERYRLLPLHSELSTAEQKQVFRHPPPGVTKVVLSTNIAEASVTIDDISFVIDGGTHKEMQYDAHTSMAALVQTRISKANAAQRAGRAGRVRAGVCYHLFLRWELQHMPAQQLPELQRSPLETTCLRIKTLGLGSIRAALSQAPEPPREHAIDHVLRVLSGLGLIQPVESAEEAEGLTPLGHALASLPVDPRIGKLVLLGAVFRCRASHPLCHLEELFFES